MKITRRKFLGLAAAVAALPATVRKAVAARIGLPAAELVRPADFDALANGRLLTAHWFQTTRTMHCSSLAWEDTVDVIMSPPGDPGVRSRWHERRKDRCRERIAELRRQRPLPLP